MVTPFASYPSTRWARRSCSVPLDLDDESRRARGVVAALLLDEGRRGLGTVPEVERIRRVRVCGSDDAKPLQKRRTGEKRLVEGDTGRSDGQDGVPEGHVEEALPTRASRAGD